MAKTKSVSIQMKEILDKFSDKVNDVLEEAADKVSQESVEKLHNTSPRRTGAYASGWTVKKESARSVIVHNATNYQLTHLLENGHVIRNKRGTYGRAPAHKHIKPVETWANKEFQRLIKEGIEQ
jgi:hypothetical protein